MILTIVPEKTWKLGRGVGEQIKSQQILQLTQRVEE